MSPMRLSVRTEEDCFPRVSGDEPDGDRHLLDAAQFSPRERG